MRVLYVEDNPANVFLVKRVARMGNHEIINLIDGQQALRKFDEINPDLVLMDIQLSGEIGGLEVVRELRERGITTPIIAVTAYAMVGDKERCLEAGCDEYMAKPLPVPRLVELFEMHSKQTEAARQASAETPDATTDSVASDTDTTADTAATITEADTATDTAPADETATDSPDTSDAVSASDTTGNETPEQPEQIGVATDSVSAEPGGSVTPTDAQPAAISEEPPQPATTDSAPDTDSASDTAATEAAATDASTDSDSAVSESTEQPDIEGR